MLTFAIPVKHHANVKDWESIKIHSDATLRSLVDQDCDSWNTVVIANEGAILPETPDRVRGVRVDFPPNSLPDEREPVKYQKRSGWTRVGHI